MLGRDLPQDPQGPFWARAGKNVDFNMCIWEARNGERNPVIITYDVGAGGQHISIVGPSKISLLEQAIWDLL